MTWFATNLNRRDWDNLAWEWEMARIMVAGGGQDMSELNPAGAVAIYNSEVSSGEIRPELLLDSMAQLFNLGHGPGGLHIVGHNQGNVRGHQGQAS